MKAENSRCLLLNGDYSPLTIISWKKAIILSIKYEETIDKGIDIIDFYKDNFIQAVNKKLPIPAVARTKKYYRIQDQQVPFSRKNIFLRDSYTCQYCNNKFDINDLTYDHVIPKSVFKKIGANNQTCWTNIVTACVSCNHIKGNRTPKQANMPLTILPTKPKQNNRTLSMIHHLTKIKTSIPNEWLLYLPESYLL